MQETGSSSLDHISAYPANYTLSIRVNSDGFCFFVSAGEEVVEPVWTLCVSNEGISSVDCFRRTFELNPVLQLGFGAVTILFYSTDYTFVPKHFAGLSIPKFIQSPRKESDCSITLNHPVDRFDGSVDYFVDKELYSLLRRSYPHAAFMPHVVELIRKLPIFDSDTLYVFAHRSSMVVLMVSNEKLHFVNTYDTTSPLDVLFFIISVWKELSMDPQSDRLVVSVPQRIKQEINEQLLLYFARLHISASDELPESITASLEKQTKHV